MLTFYIYIYIYILQKIEYLYIFEYLTIFLCVYSLFVIHTLGYYREKSLQNVLNLKSYGYHEILRIAKLKIFRIKLESVIC